MTEPTELILVADDDDPIELVARVKSALRRSKEMRAISPLTQLPGNVQIQEEVTRRVEAKSPFAVMYIDIDDFKAFNDYYGFLRGDDFVAVLEAEAAEKAAGHSFPPDA